MKDYKKNDPRMWWFYTKTGRIILLILTIALGVMIILDQLGLIK